MMLLQPGVKPSFTLSEGAACRRHQRQGGMVNGAHPDKPPGGRSVADGSAQIHPLHRANSRAPSITTSRVLLS